MLHPADFVGMLPYFIVLSLYVFLFLGHFILLKQAYKYLLKDKIGIGLDRDNKKRLFQFRNSSFYL